jgi:ribosomal protein L11 methyltransferase
MLDPETPLFVYEISDAGEIDLVNPPDSYIGLWNEDEVVYLFFTRPEDELVTRLIRRAPNGRWDRHDLKYQDWQEGVPTEGFSVAGVRFVRSDHSGDSPTAIRLDPSVVFGDGTHPTTLTCIRSMERLVRSQNIHSVLDLGTGTGIVALAAAAMGVTRIEAVDKNKLAVQTAAANAEASQYQSRISVREGEARICIDRPFDLVVANLPFQVLRDLGPLRGTSYHRNWILSGISPFQGEQLKDIFCERGYDVAHERETPPWTTITLSKKR